jgi:uncharacterized protein YggT (Ycf19 family)
VSSVLPVIIAWQQRARGLAAEQRIIGFSRKRRGRRWDLLITCRVLHFSTVHVSVLVVVVYFWYGYLYMAVPVYISTDLTSHLLRMVAKLIEEPAKLIKSFSTDLYVYYFIFVVYFWYGYI